MQEIVGPSLSQNRASEQAFGMPIARTSEKYIQLETKHRALLKPSSVPGNKSHQTDEVKCEKKSLIEELHKFERKKGLAEVIKYSSAPKSQANKPIRQQPIRNIYKSPLKAKPVEHRNREVHAELTQLVSTQLKPTQSRPAGKTISKKKSPASHTLNSQRSAISQWTGTVKRNEAVSKPKDKKSLSRNVTVSEKVVLYNKKKIICEPKAKEMEELQINETISDSIHIESVQPVKSSDSLSKDIITLAERSKIPTAAAPVNYKQAESLQSNELMPEINVEFSESDKQEINDANQILNGVSSIDIKSLLEANPTEAMNSLNEGKPSESIKTLSTTTDLERHVEPQMPKRTSFNFMITFFGFLVSDFSLLYFVSLGPSFQLHQQIVQISLYECVDNVYLIRIWHFWTWTTAGEILILAGLLILAIISTYCTMNLYLLRNIELKSAHKAKYLLCIYYVVYLGTYVYKLNENFSTYKYAFENYSPKVLGDGTNTAEENKYFKVVIVVLELMYLCYISLITIRCVYYITRNIMKNFFKPMLPGFKASVEPPPSDRVYNKKW